MKTEREMERETETRVADRDIGGDINSERDIQQKRTHNRLTP